MAQKYKKTYKGKVYTFTDREGLTSDEADKVIQSKIGEPVATPTPVAEPEGLITRPLTPGSSAPQAEPAEASPDQKSMTLQDVAKGITAPSRGLGGAAVTAQNLLTGKGLQPSLERGKEAIESPRSFKSESKGEAIAKFGGEVIGSAPAFTAGLAAAPVVGTTLASGLTVAGLSALDQLGEEGKVDPFETTVAGAFGLVLPVAARKLGALTNEGTRQVTRTTLSPQAAILRTQVERMMGQEVSQATAKAGIVVPGVTRQAGKKIVPETPDTMSSEAVLNINNFLEKTQAKAGEATGWLSNKVQKFLTGYDPKNPTSYSAKKMLDLNIGEEAGLTVDSQIFMHNMRKDLSPLERQALVFYHQKKLPKKFKLPEDVVKLTKNPTKNMKKWSDAMTNHFNDKHQLLAEVSKDPGFKENYVPQLWSFPDAAQQTGGKKFRITTPFSKHRLIPDYASGLDRGLIPKTLDASDLIGIYDTSVIKASSNNRFLTSISNMKDVDGQLVIQPFKSAPRGWKTAASAGIDHPLLSDKKVSPDIIPHLKVMLGQEWDAKWVRNVEAIKGIQKQAQLSLSLFHHTALLESLITLVGPKKATGIMANIAKGMKSGESPLFINPELSKDAAKHGVVLGAMPEFFVAQIRNAFEQVANATSKVPVIGGVTKAASRFQDIWNKGLWDHTHTGMKLWAYEDILRKNLKLMPEKSATEVKQLTAKLVNDTFGGQNWKALMVQPKFRQALNWVFLAPDWNISAFRQFGQAFTPGAAGKLPRKMWTRAALYMFAMGNMLNYANSKRATGKGKWMWENDEGSKSKIFWDKDDEGRNVYMRHGKQYREVAEFLMNDVNTFMNKLSPTVRAAIEQGVGTSASGFPLPFRGKPIRKSVPSRVKQAASSLVPFSIKGQNIGLAFPKSRGATPFRIQEMFIEAIKSNDSERMKEIGTLAASNNIDAKEQFNFALGKVKSELKREAKKEEKSKKSSIFNSLRGGK